MVRKTLPSNFIIEKIDGKITFGIRTNKMCVSQYRFDALEVNQMTLIRDQHFQLRHIKGMTGLVKYQRRTVLIMYSKTCQTLNKP